MVKLATGSGPHCQLGKRAKGRAHADDLACSTGPSRTGVALWGRCQWPA